MTMPPPLPPRKPSPVPLASGEPVDGLAPSTPGSTTQTPPPLPPRTTAAAISTEVHTPAEMVAVQQEPPPSAVTLAVTPATPPSSSRIQPLPSSSNRLELGTTTQDSNGSSHAIGRGDGVDGLGEGYPSAAPAVSSSSTFPGKPADLSDFLSSPLPSLSSAPPFLSSIPPPIRWASITILLMLLSYLRLSVFWLLFSGGLACLYWIRDNPNASKAVIFESGGEKQAGSGRAREGGKQHESDDRKAVDWVNHAMYALFPLISTDVLVPFIDLLEDALMQQVPPIVTSVRVTSPALGSQPILLTSLRPMSDEEWFASLSKADRKVTKDVKHKPTHQRQKSSASLAPTPTKGRSRSATVGTTASHSRSTSEGSQLDPDELASETRSRRKRDRVLQRISGRRGQAPQDGLRDDLSPGSAGPDPEEEGSRGREIPGSGNDPVSDAGLPGGDRQPEESCEAMDEADANVGQYVNYQVGFEYKRSESAKRKGWGLHALAYFGWGIKGVGGSEIPVYIDLLGLKGTLNIRLLLSASPPFARTAVISLPSIPDFDISAKPLKSGGLGSFNAMGIPGIKPYVRSSIAEVAKAFVSPESYSLDIDRLLLGREASLRTASVGVLQIIIHGAVDLLKTDTMGTSDPYVAISFTKFNKPLYSTRTIIESLNPIWEEPAFILVTSDAIEAGEKLRLRICDSDRFSADDAIGIVEMDLADLVEDALTGNDSLRRRTDLLHPDRPGMKVSGVLNWSVRFCPLWKMPVEEREKRLRETRIERKGEPEDVEPPWWLKLIQGVVDGKPQWEKDREQRRKDTLAWFTGEKQRDEMEAASRPSDEFASGILQFHVHQCLDLEVESLDGTYSSAMSSRKSGANGKSALADVVDRQPTENPEPPSAYVEVLLNDKLVFRTRTKQVTPLPYFNASSERFIRDWHFAKITFVVRDERDREHDPILGLVNIMLSDVFASQSQLTRWFPLVGGLGWGRIRLSLLFKPVALPVPHGVSNFDLATLEIRSLRATDITGQTDRSFSIVLETESDKSVVSSPDSGRKSIESQRSPVKPTFPDTEVEYELDESIRLAVTYRHTCSVVISFVTKSTVLKKKKVVALALLRLTEIADSELVERRLAVYPTSDVKEVMRVCNAGSGPDGPSLEPIGHVVLKLVVFPGVSRAHRKLCKRDIRFKHVYEAWEAGREVDASKPKDISAYGLNGEEEDEDQEDEDSDEDDGGVDAHGNNDQSSHRRSSSVGRRSVITLDDDAEDISERRAHSKALHKRNKGMFQMKIVRTGQFVKDKVQAKFLAGSASVAHLDRRPRGADVDIEVEGQSKL